MVQYDSHIGSRVSSWPEWAYNQALAALLNNKQVIVATIGPSLSLCIISLEIELN